jgi:hypothetical protein
MGVVLVPMSTIPHNLVGIVQVSQTTPRLCCLPPRIALSGVRGNASLGSLYPCLSPPVLFPPTSVSHAPRFDWKVRTSISQCVPCREPLRSAQVPVMHHVAGCVGTPPSHSCTLSIWTQNLGVSGHVRMDSNRGRPTAATSSVEQYCGEFSYILIYIEGV